MVFPNKIGFIITNLYIIGVIEDEKRFGKLVDDDAIRLCLLLALEVIFMGRLLWMIPCSGWLKILKQVIYFHEESRSTSDLRSTIVEYQSSWWIDNNVYFQEHVARAPPIREQHTLFETYLSKLEKARKGGKTGFMVSSIGGTNDNSVRKRWLNDLVITELNFRQHDSDEDIAQDYLREEELRLCLEDEEKLRCEHEKFIVEENRFRLDEANRLKLEEENTLQLEEQKKNK
uniref:Phospholipase-like protein n=1 Tax=Tanacetum cinerariifolium TaxID=118510 RepID=A0A699HIT9_TANCI|nr:phospholipase-like protein [Tanacetum cinerariifolium]